MTFQPREPWLGFAALLELGVGQRVKYVRGNLVPTENARPRHYKEGLTQDEFAAAIGAKARQAVIPWERNGREPRDYVQQIAALTPYPAEAFLQRAGAGASLATVDLRLQAIEERLSELATAADVEEGFEGLRVAIHDAARRRTRGAGPKTSGEPA